MEEMWDEYKLTDDQRDYIAKHLHKTVKTVECDWCGENAWSVNPFLGVVKVFTGEGEMLGAPYYPMVTITCENCGHAIFFNALQIGLPGIKSGEVSQNG